jgi:hypothetical protein
MHMKKTKDLRSQREQWQRDLEAAREERKFEASLFQKHPHDQATGEALAKKFVDATRAMADWVEVYRHMKPSHPDYREAPKVVRPDEHEVEMFFTAEQRTELEAIYDRFARFDQIDRAKAYSELLDTLERCGLAVDTLVDIEGDGDSEDIITVENLRLAKQWWNEASANAYEDGETGDGLEDE